MYRGERLNAATHLAGLLAALPAAAWLVLQALDTGSTRRAVAAGAFGIALVAVFAASTLCHSTKGRAQQCWARVDHGAIFLLIAGTATPFALVSRGGPVNWALLGGVWAVALAGAALSALGRSGRSMLWAYLAAGWMATMACAPALLDVSHGTLSLFLAGASAYTAGTYFFANPDRRAHSHGIWHLFVIAGSGLHFGAVARYVLA
jgi:hemolysin III